MLLAVAQRYRRVQGFRGGPFLAFLPLREISVAADRSPDRYSRRHVVVGSLFVWSAVTWATGHVTTYEQLLAVRAVMGVSEAFYLPAALALIADFHTGLTRSRAIGAHQMGIYVGVIVGGLSGYLADNPNFGWRWAFSACGLVGILYTLPLLLLIRNPVRQISDADHPAITPWAALRELFTNGSFILLVLYFTLPALAGWIVREWMPAIASNPSSGSPRCSFCSAAGPSPRGGRLMMRCSAPASNMSWTRRK